MASSAKNKGIQYGRVLESDRKILHVRPPKEDATYLGGRPLPKADPPNLKLPCASTDK